MFLCRIVKTPNGNQTCLRVQCLLKQNLKMRIYSTKHAWEEGGERIVLVSEFTLLCPACSLNRKTIEKLKNISVNWDCYKLTVHVLFSWAVFFTQAGDFGFSLIILLQATWRKKVSKAKFTQRGNSFPLISWKEKFCGMKKRFCAQKAFLFSSVPLINLTKNFAQIWCLPILFTKDKSDFPL